MGVAGEGRPAAVATLGGVVRVTEDNDASKAGHTEAGAPWVMYGAPEQEG